MSEWHNYQLGEIVDFIDGDRGKNYPNKDDFLIDGFCLFLNTGNVTKLGFDFTNCMFINEYKDRQLRKGKLSYGDVILTTRGTIGNVAYYNRKIKYANVRINSGMLIVREKKEATSEFVYHLFRSSLMQQRFKKFSSGSAQPQLPVKDLNCIVVSVPSYDTQKKISQCIFAYDDLIENNNRRITILEEMAQRLYREWFVHFRFPGYKNVKLVDSELGMIPEGWQSGKIGDICNKIFSGGTPTTTNDEYWNGGLPWLSSGETRNSFVTETEKSITKLGVEKSSTRKANTKDVVIASAGQGKTRGQTSYLLLDTYINQSVIALRGKENVSEYLFLNIKGRYPELRSASDSSSIRGSITTVLMSGLDIIIPDDEVLKEFSYKVSLIIKQIAILQRKSNTLRKTRDLLLPRLISGDIDVSKIEL